jgi:hypothetical protein
MKRKGDSSNPESKKSKKSNSPSQDTDEEEMAEKTTPIKPNQNDKSGAIDGVVNTTVEEKKKTARMHAKEWFDIGKIVVPLVSNKDGKDNDGKYPCVQEWQETTLEQSKKYLEKTWYKNNNWGLLTGKVNGLYVLDLDMAKENQLSGVSYVLDFMEKNGIQCNYMVKTGSGGRHLYFKYDEKIHLKQFAGLEIEGKKYGIDVRSDGGQIVLPGSFHYKSEKKYELICGNPSELGIMDEKLFEHLKLFAPSKGRRKNSGVSSTLSTLTSQLTSSSEQNSQSSPSLEIDQIVNNVFKRLDPKRADSYDDWVRGLIYLKSRGEQYKEIAKTFSQKSHKFQEDDFEEKWRTVISANSSRLERITLGTFLFWLNQDDLILNPSGFLHSKVSLTQFLSKYDTKTIEIPILYSFQIELQNCVARIGESREYISRSGENRIQVASYNEFKDMVSGYHLLQENPKDSGKEGKSKIKMYSFIHDDMKEYITFSYKEFRPVIGNYKDQEGNHVFNTFYGFGANSMDYQMEDLDDGSDFSVLGFIKAVLADGDPLVYEYLLDWMRCVRHDPENPCGVALVFISKEGSGKNTFWEEFFGNLIMGEKNSLTTEGIKRIADDFNNIIEDKLFIAMDEAKVNKSQMGCLKRLITGKTVEIHQKHKDLRTKKNFSNYILLTNDRKPFDVLNRDQRRFAIFNVNSKYAGIENESFWRILRQHLLSSITASKFTKFLKDRPPRQDMRKWPITQCFEQMMDEQEIHPIMEYLRGEEFARELGNREVSATLLLERCIGWLKSTYPNQAVTLNAPRLKRICCDQLGWEYWKSHGKMTYKRKEVPREFTSSLPSTQLQVDFIEEE